MLPSRSWQEEPDSTGPACPAPPPIQVKILRRPKPNDSHHQLSQSSSNTNQNQVTTSSNRSVGFVATEPKSDQVTSSVSLYDNDEEWPSIADAACKAQRSQWKSKHNVIESFVQSTTSDKIPSAIMSKTGSSATVVGSNQRLLGISNGNRAPKAPIKTYKERADDYAKARLRILGSAFSDEDKANADGSSNNR